MQSLYQGRRASLRALEGQVPITFMDTYEGEIEAGPPGHGAQPRRIVGWRPIQQRRAVPVEPGRVLGSVDRSKHRLAHQSLALAAGDVFLVLGHPGAAEACYYGMFVLIACGLLQDTDMAVGQVAAALRYSELSAFTRAFRR